VPPQPPAFTPRPAASGIEQPSPSSGPVQEPADGASDATWLPIVGAAVVGIGIGAVVAVRRRRPPGASA
jgi:LPXTG-motif cell wall-anchored protein